MIIVLFFKLNKKFQKSDSIFFLDTSEIWTRVSRVTVTRTTVPTTHYSLNKGAEVRVLGKSDFLHYLHTKNISTTYLLY